MERSGEYQGGFYVIIEFIGLYVRYFILKILHKNKTIKYLSGEENFSKINKKQRFYCLIVGLVFMLFLLFIIIIVTLQITS
jgi:uncharacterized membrane protein